MSVPLISLHSHRHSREVAATTLASKLARVYLTQSSLTCFHSNSYPTPASGAGAGGGGYGARRPNPYAQQDDRSYEMSAVKDTSANYNGSDAAVGGDMSSFYTEVRNTL